MEKQILCQSCGVLIGDDELLGTEKDGSVNNDYCNECYYNGEFTLPNLTIDEMKDIIIDEMERRGTSGEKIDIAVQNMNNLKRWN